MYKSKIKEKSFIITVDTEGDNLWSYQEGDVVKTENSLAIPRFQELCEKFQFKPIYLTNYEMINDNRFVDYIKDKVHNGLCEIGIHIHAWNNPPYYKLEKKYNGNPYLIEYPEDIMRAKFEMTYNLIKERIGITPISHRAGRWAMDNRYFDILKDFNIKIDCSYTPGINWNNAAGKTINCGSNYSHINQHTHYINDVLEVPMSIRKIHYLKTGNIKSKLKTLIKGNYIWLRPAISSIEEIKLLCNKISKESDTDYLEFMVHSSELLESASPYFKDNKDIENLYSNLEELFKYVSRMGYKGKTLIDYYNHNEQNK